MNISILFQNQSLVVFFSFWLILYYLNKKYVELKSTSFQLDILEWLETMQFFIMMKNWGMLLIRLLNLNVIIILRISVMLGNIQIMALC